MKLRENPLIFQIETTSICNLSCKMCPYSMITRLKHHMTWTEFTLVARYLEPGQKVGLHVMGEPLLNHNIVRMIQYLTNRGVKAELATNATFMTPAFAEQLILAGLHEIWFSIDSADPFEYERIRGRPLIDAIYHARIFLEVNRRYGDPVIAVVQKIGPLTDAADSQAFLKMWDGWDARIKFLDTWAGTFAFDIPETTVDRYPCAEPWERVAVLVDGSVVPCCRDWQPKYVYGNIFSESLHEIWYGEKAQALREDILSGTYSIEPCASCREWMIPMDRDVVECE